MGLNILLVNPNTFKHPPVVPIGLEYLMTTLEKHGHLVDLLDLCFSSDPIRALSNKLNENDFDLVGFTIRNIDSAMYFNNEFFLPAIKELIRIVKNHEVPVVIGGAGFSAMPWEILSFLHVDHGILGPGEQAFPHFLESWQAKKTDKKRKVYQFPNLDINIDNEMTHLRGNHIDYKKYISESGIVGFQTHKGCSGECHYCMEANTRINLRPIVKVIEEIRYLVDQGHAHFHLCDSEFNEDLSYSINFCKELIKSKIALKWALYMKPKPYNEELFKVLSESNAYLITLSVESDGIDSKKYCKENNAYTYSDLAKIIKYCKKYELKLAIDLLVGYPNETLDSIKKMIDFFKENQPSTVGISFYFRIYNNTKLALLIQDDEELQQQLTRSYTKEETFLEPIFFRQNIQVYLEQVVKEDNVFKLAGLTLGVNYQQA